MHATPSTAQATTEPFPSALAETTRQYELAFGAVLRADRLLARLAAFSADPSDTNRELLAQVVATTLPAVHTVLAEAGIPPASGAAFARYECTAAGEAAVRAAQEQPGLSAEAACPHCGRVRGVVYDGASVRCFGCWRCWIPAPPPSATACACFCHRTEAPCYRCAQLCEPAPVA